MAKPTEFVVIYLLTLLSVAGCARKSPPEDPAAWKKIKMDLSRLDENGLAGPAGGKVAVNYEFCIPAREKNWKEIQRIDKTAQLQKQSKGRIGCQSGTWLVIGSTHQPNHRRVLYELAVLSYVQQIQETFFE